MKMFKGDEDPEGILRDEEAFSVSKDGELEKIAQSVMEENPNAVADFKKGKIASLQFLVGKAMGKLKGRGNPEALRNLFQEKLNL